MIDIHVLTHSGTRPDWLAQCLASMEGQPCTVHVLPGIEGNIAAGRQIGFGLGTHDYVAYVDSDDYLLPGCVQMALDALASGVAAVVTDELVTENEIVIATKPYHHLHVVRRDVITPFLPTYGYEGKGLHCCVMLDRIAPAQRIATPGYVWRRDGHWSHIRADLWY